MILLAIGGKALFMFILLALALAFIFGGGGGGGNLPSNNHHNLGPHV